MIPKFFISKIEEAEKQQSEELDLSSNISADDATKLTDFPQAIFNLKYLKSLKMANNNIKKLPESIGNLSNLVTLDLSRNQLKELPESIGNLSKLVTLDLKGNQLKELPESIGNLLNLETLILTGNRLKKLPEPIGNLLKLTQLYLSSNKLEKLPEFIGKLLNLTILNLDYNKLEIIPESIGNCTSINELIIIGNQLKNLPESIGNLSNLETLILTGNQLENLPESIANLLNLNELDLKSNKLKNLDESIININNLLRLELGTNPLEQPPIEIANRGFEAIKEYFRQLEEEGKDYIYEAKLLIVGDTGAGKTTLAKKINDPNYDLKKDGALTEGIDITKWKFTLDNDQEFTVNIWDFGSQEIYHATHQFFLTRRSLYTLVADTKREDTNFYSWLNVVEILSESSPLLIIKNEKQDRKREINERALRRQFDNLKETIATNLATNRGLEDILKNIKHYITNLPHIGSLLPKNWVKVRQALEKDKRSSISIEEYFQICDNNGFKSEKDKLQLSSYLHDLGVCLHFQDDENSLLYRTVILNPEWGTNAVYKVLDDKKIINEQGFFTGDDLKHIWSEAKYASKRAELLELMKKFQLCYEISSQKNSFIAPQLLSENQPEYDWDDSNNLILRYRYPDFMIKGIITRFIVVMHQYIYCRQQSNSQLAQCVWKSGVVLAKNNAKAEVIENYGKREITIRVSGDKQRDLMILVTYELDKINASYRRLKYKKLIPCNCAVCKNNQSPYFYSFETLIKLFKNQIFNIQCLESFEWLNVIDLLDDVLEIRELSLLGSNRLSTSIINQNTFEVQNYVEQIKIQGSAPLHEAKILIVGEPGAGKTTLMKKLIDPKYKVPTQEKSTLGITVYSNWQFPYTKDPEISFKANIWDFGGQEIQYTLHHFFLTSQSLYILVVDDRRQHTDFDYWFNIIRILGGNSPVLVVLNEKNYQSITNFDLKSYSERYSEQKLECRDVDFSENNGLFQSLVQKIQEMLSNLEHIGEKLPAKWVFVRAELEQLKSRNYISVEEYFDICDQHEIKEEEDKLLLSKCLHNLGIVLHFKDDSSLSNTIFLNPQWVVDGVYTVLSNRKLKEDGGKFSKDWLFQILANKKYSFKERNILLNLMKRDNFDLCYQMNFPHRNEYIFPQLLPSEKLNYEWNCQNNLKFRFEYTFMPKGIISQLIVRLSSFIDKDDSYRDLAWKKGVVFIKNDDFRKGKYRVLEKDMTRAEVIEEIEQKVIKIKVSGLPQEKKELLSIIRKEILDIHNRFEGLVFKEKIPCNCEECVSSNEPFFYDYNYDILRRLQKKIHLIECGESFQKIEILSLIDNVIDSNNLLTSDDKLATNINITPKITVKLDQSQDKSQNITQQTHSGSGDNVGGDKKMGDKNDTQSSQSF
ncbi:MAG: COR domain-containing protein [Xenococcus sp. MO_188.B8]|nr:COR domain-containing protein [Xenococcus sp. MO_188.B8]